MNFYRLRFINTVIIFIIGVMIGFYVSTKKGFIGVIKKSFSISSNYIPVYYNKKKIDNDYTPRYYNNSLVEKSSYNAKVRNKELIDEIKKQNPISDDEENFILIDTPSLKNEDTLSVKIEDFIKDPSNYKNFIVSAKLILLKGEIKEYPILYFLYSSNYYLTIRDERGVITDKTEYKIGYFYDVTFLTEGALNSNILVSITSTGDKTNWSMGVNAF